MKKLVALFALAALGHALSAPPPAAAQSLEPAAPESVGLSAQRLERLSAALRRAVDGGQMAGAVVLVARHGRLAHFEAYGELDRARHTPMRTDALFRIASQTKAVTSVAAMMLLEEGRLLLGDPVARFIPAFARTAVFVPADETTGAGAGQSVPARRAITVRDLLTHTAGLSYGWGPLEARYQEERSVGWYFADRDETIGRAVERLAGLPFEAQPGERWIYGYSSDILGHVVEKASGLSLDEFFRTRIFEPLRMADTHFFVPREKAARLATVYAIRQPGGPLERAPDGGDGQGHYVEGPRRCFSGGAGLVSTAMDYARFLEMLRRGGELDGARLLGRKSVELMTSNQVGSLYEEGRFGFGLGFEVTEHVGRSGRLGSVGEFGWGGAYHSKYWVDPAEGLVVVLMTQLHPAPSWDFHDLFRNLVYQAIVDPAPAPASSQ